MNDVVESGPLTIDCLLQLPFDDISAVNQLRDTAMKGLTNRLRIS